MSSTSQKHRNFVAEPMGEKLCTGKRLLLLFVICLQELGNSYFFHFSDLAGIGETLGKRLTDKGFDKAYTVSRIKAR